MGDYENIPHPDSHQFGDTMLKQITILRAEYAYLEKKYDSVCSDLNSIINRADAGDVVYVEMPDGSRLYLAKVTQEGGESDGVFTQS